MKASLGLDGWKALDINVLSRKLIFWQLEVKNLDDTGVVWCSSADYESDKSLDKTIIDAYQVFLEQGEVSQMERI